MEIRIHLSRPWLTLGIVTVVLLWWNGVISINGWNTSANLAAGGERPSTSIADAVQDIDREHVKQAVLERREEILRYQVQVLEREALAAKTPATIEAVNNARDVLLSIIKQKSASEKLLLGSLQQLWEAEGSAFTFRGIDTDTVLLWPVSPRLGISAHFADEGYEKLFGFAHHAIDIPAEQGTLIQSPADGTVVQVAMNGLGYSFVVLQHANGVQTVYGHVSKSLVQEGDTVVAGEDFAETGGMPGSVGAGSYTTGPHLHFAVKINGVLVDPMKYLPKI